MNQADEAMHCDWCKDAIPKEHLRAASLAAHMGAFLCMRCFGEAEGMWNVPIRFPDEPLFVAGHAEGRRMINESDD